MSDLGLDVHVWVRGTAIVHSFATVSKGLRFLHLCKLFGIKVKDTALVEQGEEWNPPWL